MLWVGQFGIAGGQAQEETPWIGVFPEETRGPDSSDLYLIVEPATADSAEFCAELKEAIGAVFHSTKASITGGLLRALQGAHENLREWNRRSMRDNRVAAGVSCVAVRGREAYLAQVAPASAAFFREGSLRPLQPSLPDATEPLGLFDEFWPEFSQLRDGSRRPPAAADASACARLAPGRAGRVAGARAGRRPAGPLPERPLATGLRRGPCGGAGGRGRSLSVDD